jgi:hypothetical protein
VRKISPPIGIRSPDRPARSQSLYRLSYPAHVKGLTNLKTLLLVLQQKAETDEKLFPKKYVVILWTTTGFENETFLKKIISNLFFFYVFGATAPSGAGPPHSRRF